MELGLSQAILAWGPDPTILLFFTVTCAADHSNLRLLDPVRAGTDLKPATVLLPRLLLLVVQWRPPPPAADSAAEHEKNSFRGILSSANQILKMAP